jgi:hypothetical protein
MQALFSGASAEVGGRLGMPASPASGAEADIAAFRRWRADLSADPDLARDARMMVSVFFDRGRQKTKVWALLGWARRPVVIGYARPPKAEVFRGGQKLLGQEAPEVRFVSEFLTLTYRVSAEIYVTKLLDRDQFRQHCDRFKTRAAILEDLR